MLYLSLTPTLPPTSLHNNHHRSNKKYLQSLRTQHPANTQHQHRNPSSTTRTLPTTSLHINYSHHSTKSLNETNPSLQVSIQTIHKSCVHIPQTNTQHHHLSGTMPTTETTIARLQTHKAELLAAINALEAQPPWVKDDPHFVRKRRELESTYVSRHHN
jgi:hypothetical protein